MVPTTNCFDKHAMQKNHFTYEDCTDPARVQDSVLSFNSTTPRHDIRWQQARVDNTCASQDQGGVARNTCMVAKQPQTDICSGYDRILQSEKITFCGEATFSAAKYITLNVFNIHFSNAFNKEDRKSKGKYMKALRYHLNFTRHI